MKLYTFPPSPNAVKVVAVMNYLGLTPDETVIVDLTKGENRSPDFLSLNPNGMIPVLEDGDLVLSESNAIILYLAEKHKSTLLPEGLTERSRVHEWLSWQLAHFGPAVGGVVLNRVGPKFIPGMVADEHHLQTSLERVARFAPVLDNHLRGRTYLVGDQPTLADIAVASMLIHAEMGEVPLEPFHNIDAWYKRVVAHDWFSKARGNMPAPV